MAFPENPTIIDDFTRPDAPTLGSNWTQVSFGVGDGPAIISNQVGPDSATDFSEMYWNQRTYGSACEAFIEIVIVIADDQDQHGIIVAQGTDPIAPGTFDGYQVSAFPQVAGDEIAIIRFDNGVGTHLGASVAQAISDGDAIGIRRVGNDIQGWHRTGGVWTLKITRTDSTYTGPFYLGFYSTADSSAWRLDNFGGGEIGGDILLGQISI